MSGKDEKIKERETFQNNINGFGESLEKCKTIDDVKQILSNTNHMNEIIIEINKKRGMFSDSKKPLQKFGQVFNKSFFDNIMDSSNIEKFNLLINACNELQKAGSNKKVSEKAVIKNIDMKQLINGISRCSNNIMMNIEKNTQNLLKFSAELNDLFTSKETKIEDIIKILESFKKNFELLKNEKLVALIDNAITCLKGDNEENVFQSFKKLNDSMDEKHKFIKEFNKWFETNIFKGNSESPTETFDDMKLNTNKIKQEFRKSVSLVSKSLVDGILSANDDKLIDFQVLKILSTVKKSIGKDTPKKLDKLEIKLNKCKNPGEEANIVVEIVKLLLKDKTFKHSALRKGTPENSAISSLRKIIVQLINVSKGLKGTGEMTNENQKIYEDTIDGVSDLFKESLKDGVLTAEEINTIKENVKKIIDESPVDGKNMGDINKIKEDIKSELDKELSSVTDEIKVYEVVNSILDKIVKKTGEKNQQIVQSNTNKLKKKISELEKQAPSGPASQGTTNQGTAGEKAIEDFISALNGSKFFDDVKNAKTLESATTSIEHCIGKVSNIFNSAKAKDIKDEWSDIATYIDNTKGLLTGSDLNALSPVITNFVKLSDKEVLNKKLSKKMQSCAQAFKKSYDEALAHLAELKKQEEEREKVAEELISSLNGSKFFDDVANANTVAEAHEKIKNCAQNIYENVFASNKEMLEKDVKLKLPGLYNWCNIAVNGIDSIVTSPGTFEKFQTHITALQNLSKKMPVLKSCADSLQTSYTAAVNKIEELKQEEELKKKQEDIKNELKTLWVVKNGSKKDNKTPSAFEIYDGKKMLSDNWSLNPIANMQSGYVLVNNENKVQHSDYYPHSRTSINKDNKKANIEVKKFLEVVVEHGKWPASKEEAKEWVK